MNQDKYFKRFLVLSAELERIANTIPYDSIAYNALIDVLNELRVPYNSRQRRRPWLITLFLFVLFCILALIVFVLIL